VWAWLRGGDRDHKHRLMDPLAIITQIKGLTTLMMLNSAPLRLFAPSGGEGYVRIGRFVRPAPPIAARTDFMRHFPPALCHVQAE
jgi:hypothetical protein